MKYDIKSALRLYLVTDRPLSLGRPLEEVVSEAVAGGVTMVQLREKECPTGEFIALARRLKALLAPLGVPLIINDRVDVALAADADGVHIGQSDMHYEDARRLLGRDKIIGLSVENFSDLERANSLDVDYVGISPVYGTPTKSDTAEPFGLEGLRRAVALSTHPTVAIGGMNAQTIGAVMATGTDGVAVVSAICSAPSPRKAAEELNAIINQQTDKIMSWTKEVWQKSLPIYERIIRHPFITELADGTLATERFARYLAQDEIYIKNYGEEMFLLADMLPDEAMRKMFRAYAEEGMAAEAAMHQMLIDNFGIDTAVEPSEVTAGYMAHTRKYINTGNPALALAAMLPCMWIYNEVGLYIYNHRNPNPNPYSEWVATYASEDFTEGTRQILEMCDRYAEEATPEMREEMTRAYLVAAEYEWAFWNWGYHGEN
ncbi:MAG: thiamine phosphate synthase [Tidjanibacter sp.]|nr:thiamine phosphate synthase [Tidjanibacter sp.]